MDNTPIHNVFGLTYASWFVCPRVILEAMSVEWQKQFIDLIAELNEQFDWEPDDCIVEIRFRKDGKFVKVPEYYNNYRRPDREWIEAIIA